MEGQRVMRIFYSWQMDAPRKINKDFIRRALNRAIDKLSEDPDVSEAERDEMEVDQDTQGVLGSPEVARVILNKIANSSVVVADVSLVAFGKDNKRHINSNVAIELGYAYGELGDEAVLKIMNTHFGKPDELPFDLRARRHPVQYHLEPTADPATIAAEEKKLVKELARILKSYLENSLGKQKATHIETPSTALRGMFWKLGEPLVPVDDPRPLHNVFWSGCRLLYFRCIPLGVIPELSPLEALSMISELRPLVSQRGYGRSRNKWGALTYDLSTNGDLIGLSQLFRNREIWSIDAYYSSLLTSLEDDDEQSLEYIPTSRINDDYPFAIDSIRKLAAELNYGKRYEIEMGLSGAEGIRLLVGSGYNDPYLGPIYKNEVHLRKSIADDYPTKSIMNDFWELLFSEAGHPVPEELVWLPPR